MKFKVAVAKLEREAIVTPEGHWLLTGWSNRPKIKVQGRVYLASRVMLANRGLMKLSDLTVLACHTCDNPLCFNPAHLYVGNKSTNALDREDRLFGRV